MHSLASASKEFFIVVAASMGYVLLAAHEYREKAWAAQAAFNKLGGILIKRPNLIGQRNTSIIIHTTESYDPKSAMKLGSVGYMSKGEGKIIDCSNNLH